MMYLSLFIFSSSGRRPAGLCHGLVSVVYQCFLALTFISNIFSETTHPVSLKFHRNVPAINFSEFFSNNLIPSKTLVAVATKLKNIQNL